MNKETLVKYYEYTTPFYKYFWHWNSYGLHYGFWDENIKSHRESILNVNKFLAEKTDIKSNDVILDAGCGVGGSSIWIAENYKAHVTGITISEKQVAEAKKLARKRSVGHLTEFYLMDYTDTNFNNESFDIVWALESVSHAENKFNFIKEAYRLLKKGGRIIIDDGFLKRDIHNENEKNRYNAFLEGLALPNLADLTQFETYLKETGFKNIKCWDKVKDAFPSSRIMHRLCMVAYPMAKITEKLKITSNIITKNNLAGIIQYEIMKSGLFGHAVFYGEK